MLEHLVDEQANLTGTGGAGVGHARRQIDTAVTDHEVLQAIEVPANDHLAIRLNRQGTDERDPVGIVRDHVADARSGIESRIQRTVRIESGNTAASHAVVARKFSANDDPAVGLEDDR